MFGEISLESDFALLESIRQHLLDDNFDNVLEESSPTGSGNPPPMFCRSFSFSALFSEESWSDMPLNVDDNNDVVVSSGSTDSGWSPSSDHSHIDVVETTPVKPEPQEVVLEGIEVARETHAPSSGRHFRGVYSTGESSSSSASSDSGSPRPKRRNTGVSSVAGAESGSESLVEMVEMSQLAVVDQWLNDLNTAVFPMPHEL
ncbi:ethylene-responsive transcription factor 1A-like [Prunus avium]|uniref:Ethylene-responsive transcription factor 1A-like n=1 Tax=Prunus avium TaxID=42229 RepID=A0A6P5TN07_PRUAV|nr:ethylene-responsive transcription factor 1A-like [Prunus avium]